MSSRATSRFTVVTKEVFWTPAVASVAAVSGVSFFWSSLRYTLFASVHFNLSTLNWVLSWHWQSWLAFWSFVMTMVIFKGTVDAIHRREEKISALDQHSLNLREKLQQATTSLESGQEKTRQLEAGLEGIRSSYNQLQTVNRALKAQLDRAAGLSLSLKTEGYRKRIWIATHQSLESAPIHALVSDLTLTIYNHGEKPVRLHGCKIWKLHATEQIQELPIETLSTPQEPTNISVTDCILRILSRSERPYFKGLPGKCTIRISVSYFRHAEACADEKSQDFELVCVQQGGATTLRIEATEISATQP